MELTLNLDEHGRTTTVPSSNSTSNHDELKLNYTTHSVMFENFNEQICYALIQDCKLTTSSELPLTFWISYQDTPRCLLEQLAMDIFMHHVKSSNTKLLDPKTCGAEWWVQLRPSPNQNRINSQSEEAQRGIEFHWDKDEALRDVGGLFVHPHISTVTYLTDNGAPTMVYEGSMPDEGLMDRGMSGAFISWPRRGKHLCFDGRLLHGAPSDLQKKLPKDIRVTFLVNIWLHHKPLGVESFPEAFIHMLNKKMDSNWKVAASDTLCSLSHDVFVNNKDAIDTDIVDFTWGLGEMVSIHAKLPIKTIREERRKEDHSGNVKISWSSDNMAILQTSNC
jgi:hypothetical protein